MSANEEVEEHAQHAREPFDKRVAATMAIIAATLAIVSVLGHILTTEELLHQQEASDQWAYSQAKDIRHYVAQAAHDIINEGKGNPEVVGKYGADDARYKNETTEIREKAREYETDSRKAGHKALRMHAGEVFLEVAIVLSSLAILAKRKWLWLGGIVSAGVGAAVALTASLVT